MPCFVVQRSRPPTPFAVKTAARSAPGCCHRTSSPSHSAATIAPGGRRRAKCEEGNDEVFVIISRKSWSRFFSLHFYSRFSGSSRNHFTRAMSVAHVALMAPCVEVPRGVFGDVSDDTAKGKTDPMASFNQEVLEEAGSDYEPAYEEIVEYARWLGITQAEDACLLWIAKQGLGASLPEGWKPCRTGDGQVYYFNFATGESDWDHPCDAVFRGKVVLERGKLAGGNDTSVTATTRETTPHNSFHSADGNTTTTGRHAKQTREAFLDDLASDVSGDAKDVSTRTHDRSFPQASPRPPSRKGSPSPRPVGPVSLGFGRTPLRAVNGNVTNNADLNKSGAKLLEHATSTTASPRSARSKRSDSRRKGSVAKKTPCEKNDENDILNFSNLSSASLESNESHKSGGKRGRLAALPVRLDAGCAKESKDVFSEDLKKTTQEQLAKTLDANGTDQKAGPTRTLPKLGSLGNNLMKQPLVLGSVKGRETTIDTPKQTNGTQAPSPKLKKMTFVAKKASSNFLTERSFHDDSKSFPSLILDDEISVEVLGFLGDAAVSVCGESKTQETTRETERLRLALATAELETKAAVTARDAAEKARKESVRALDMAQAMLQEAEANTKVSTQETETARLRATEAETNARRFEAAANAASKRAETLEASSAEVRRELETVKGELRVATILRESNLRTDAFPTEAFPQNATNNARAVANAIQSSTNALTSVFRDGFETQKTVWISERTKLVEMASDLVERAERAASTANDAARTAQRAVVDARRYAPSPTAAAKKTNVSARPTSPRPPKSPTSSGDTPKELGASLHYIAARATSASASPNNSSSMESLTDVSASSMSMERLSIDISRRENNSRPTSPVSDAGGDYSGGRISIRGRNLKPQPPTSREPSPVTSLRGTNSKSNSPRERSFIKVTVDSRNVGNAKAFASAVSKKESGGPFKTFQQTYTGPEPLNPKHVNPKGHVKPKGTSPASLAAQAAAETCLCLVKRLETLRAGNAAAARRGWVISDQLSREKREGEMQDWIAREQKSLASFRMVAALLG